MRILISRKNMHWSYGFSRIAILCTAGLSILVATGILFSITPAREKFLNILTSNIAVQPVIIASPASFMQVHSTDSTSSSQADSTSSPQAGSGQGSISQSSSSNQVARILGDSSYQPADSKITFVTTPPASSTVLFMTPPVVSSETKKQFARILISQVLLEDEQSTRHEFVELYNPNEYAVDLSGWELRKKTETGTDSVLVSSKKFAGIIARNGYFLISNPEYSQTIGADEVWSSDGYGVSKNNTVYMVNPDGGIADLVGFGEAQNYESASAQNPDKGIALSRVSSKDTNMNQNDFVCAIPVPRNTKSTIGFRTLEIVACANQGQNIAVSPAPSPIASPELSPSPLPSPTLEPSPSVEPSPMLSPTPSLIPTPSPSPTSSPQPTQKLLISEVQITGGAGETNNDFIELYNPNDGTVNLKGYRLVKRTKTGASDYAIKSWTTDTFIYVYGTYVWANNDFVEKTADARTSTTLANDNAIALRYGSADTGQIIDSVGWGEHTGVFCETQCFAQNPVANEVLTRKNMQDTYNNALDFEIR
ncbi:MAG: hypothetical protein COZ64_00665 [Candidatus Brennerbacteria bacterium CG_4_8_14_3_um_filter_43_14]|uniref:LTD domain-containing protein n=2 Tax=Candidatus Brenneribacteriota TaxID=1817902 RepID=A0A2M8C1T9_9BACT|nr:MAG: hypothetical protein AUJ43_00715 [Parcubacteria group bacterium CG1_02_44_31]PIX29218.1 MAG: hypothetical protein COZ64_00665 [Candidatus Brennerbacteria bacterium CG_4_8_14_3_um_filter_43_14]PJB50070.1 MAG: hypothetical protein CO102_02075 [Candidatus Brennerbacteria bacterium CG_4_9_14_3_um_filter_43_9]